MTVLLVFDIQTHILLCTLFDGGLFCASLVSLSASRQEPPHTVGQKLPLLYTIHYIYTITQISL